MKTTTLSSAEAAARLGIEPKSLNRLVRGLKLRPCEGTTIRTWRFTEDAIARRIVERDAAQVRKQPPPITPRRQPIFWGGERF